MNSLILAPNNESQTSSKFFLKNQKKKLTSKTRNRIESRKPKESGNIELRQKNPTTKTRKNL
jgi:hypothetical protein